VKIMQNKLQYYSAYGTLFFLSAIAADMAHAEVTVKIGYAGPLTGGIARIGKDSENAVSLAIDEINAKGLIIKGQKISLVLESEDDAGDPKTATQVAQKLVDNDVVAVVGHLQSGTSIAAARIYSEASVAEVSPSATNPTYTMQGLKTTFRMVATDAKQGPALAGYASRSMKVRTVAIVDDSTAYGQGLAEEFELAAKKLGLQVLSHDAVNTSTVDFRSVLTKIKGERPDVIMFGGDESTAGPFAKQAFQLSLRSKLLFGDGGCTEGLAVLAGDAADAVVCSQAGMGLDRMPGGPNFSVLYENRFHTPVIFAAPYAYDAAHIIVDAMIRSQSTDRAKVLETIRSTHYRGVTGDSTFDEHGDQLRGSISIYRYVHGKREYVETQQL
jgi:branched-chain amino acid transport system substrate-binding protein